MCRAPFKNRDLRHPLTVWLHFPNCAGIGEDLEKLEGGFVTNNWANTSEDSWSGPMCGGRRACFVDSSFQCKVNSRQHKFHRFFFSQSHRRGAAKFINARVWILATEARRISSVLFRAWMVGRVCGRFSWRVNYEVISLPKTRCVSNVVLESCAGK